MLSFLFKKKPPAGPPYDITKNPWRVKRRWPPDFAQLSQKEQFKFERRFRRRHKLKWARPVWTKSIKIAQWGSIISVLVYGVFFYEDKPGSKEQPFAFARDWYQRTANSIFPSLTRPNEHVVPNQSSSSDLPNKHQP